MSSAFIAELTLREASADSTLCRIIYLETTMRTSTAIPVLSYDDPPSGPYTEADLAAGSHPAVARAVTQIRVSAPGRSTGVMTTPTMAAVMVADAAPSFAASDAELAEELRDERQISASLQSDLLRERAVSKQAIENAKLYADQLEIERGVAAAAVKQIGVLKLQFRAAAASVSTMTSQLKAARARWHEIATIVDETLDGDA